LHHKIAIWVRVGVPTPAIQHGYSTDIARIQHCFDRLVEKGKSKKLALIAVVNKLLKQAFAIATKKEYYSVGIN
jgi:hypothetical protein